MLARAAIWLWRDVEADPLSFRDSGAGRGAARPENGALSHRESSEDAKHRGPWPPRASEAGAFHDAFFAPRPQVGSAPDDHFWTEEFFGSEELETALESIAESLGRLFLLEDYAPDPFSSP